MSGWASDWENEREKRRRDGWKMNRVSCGTVSRESNHLARSHSEGEQERGRREEDGMWEEYQCTRPDKGKMKEERLRQRPRLTVSPRLLASRPQVLMLLPPLCSKTCFFYSCNLSFVLSLFNPSLTSTLLEEQQICGWGPGIQNIIILKSFNK